jgi:putative transposase
VLTIIDDVTKECLAAVPETSLSGKRVIRVDRKLNSTEVIDALTDLFILRSPPEFMRSDNVLCRERIAA